MNVLSLFDGVSCGKVALDRAGIEIDTYYSSEIDEYPQMVSKANHSDIIYLGDITLWRSWDIDWSSIDLLLGGSPCQGFSSAGKQLAFDDPRSSLFFTYVEILNHIKICNEDVKFLLENVKMKKEYLDIISGNLGVKPVFINSNSFSAQSRQRFYWCNWDIAEVIDQGVTLNDVLDIGYYSDREKSYCIDANYAKGSNFMRYFYRNSRQIVFENGYLPIVTSEATANTEMREQGNRWRKLTVKECCRLQTLPEDYFDFEGMSDVKSYKCIGNGWTVDVIAHILKSIN